MSNRKKRVEMIVDIIRNNCISSQEQLSTILAEKGYPVTQATLSRDLKMLKTTKVATDLGSYMYMLPDVNQVKDKLIATGQNKPSHNEGIGFISIEFSGNMCVVKTRNGYAPGLAYDIDMIGAPEILGTIPGSNTIFIALREGVSHDKAKAVLSRILPLDQKIPSF